jgi:hypothetical protein
MLIRDVASVNNRHRSYAGVDPADLLTLPGAKNGRHGPEQHSRHGTDRVLVNPVRLRLAG